MGVATVAKVKTSRQCPEPQRGLVGPCFNILPPARAYTLSQHALCHQGCKSRHFYWELLVYHHDNSGPQVCTHCTHCSELIRVDYMHRFQMNFCVIF